MKDKVSKVLGIFVILFCLFIYPFLDANLYKYSILYGIFKTIIFALLLIFFTILHSLFKKSPFLKDKRTELTIFMTQILSTLIFLLGFFPYKNLMQFFGTLFTIFIFLYLLPFLFYKDLFVFWKEEILKHKGKRLFIREEIK
ncbi:MAG: hypothetical protein ABIN20_09105 [candidate division WOR-3 bacterium]